MTTPRPRPATVTAPDGFFVPGARYYDGDGYKAPEQTHTFDCEHVTIHPRPGAGPRAFGFVRNNAPGSDWFSTALGEDDFTRWTRIGDAPTGQDAGSDAQGEDTRKATCECSNGYTCPHRCWNCKSARSRGCEEWCHIRPFGQRPAPAPEAAATEPPAAEQTVFHTVLTRLAALGIHCRTETGTSGTSGTYHFTDDIHLRWGAFSNTGAENALHPISAHGHLEAFHTCQDHDLSRDFTTGDFTTDAAALIDWITTLNKRHSSEHTNTQPHPCEVEYHRVNILGLEPDPPIRIGTHHDHGPWIIHMRCACPHIDGLAAEYERLSHVADQWLNQGPPAPWELCPTSSTRLTTPTGSGHVISTSRTDQGTALVRIKHPDGRHTTIPLDQATG